MKRVFVDTSAWFSFADGRDAQHDAVRTALTAHRGGLVSSNFVFDEVVTLCRVRAGHKAACRVGAVLLDLRVVELVRVTSDDERAAWELFESRADQSYSFTDCTSFVLMRRLKLTCAISLDADFGHEGFDTLP